MENQKKESPEPSTERDSECDCDEQREAKAALEEMKKGLRFLREQQAAGQAPSPSDPEEATIENGFEGEMEWLESESRRPSSRRLSVSADPPREVLKALVRTTVLDPQDLQVEEDYTLNLSILRFVKERDGSMGVGFSLSKRKAWTPPTDPDVQVAVMEWQDSFGAWPVVNWAWLIALVLRKLPEEFREIANITPSYKLQHSPQQDFCLRMREAFVDVCRTNRLRDFSAPFLSAIFMFHPSHPQFDLGRRQDCALFFDTRLWTVARDLGFQVQDRTQRPAFTYFIGKSDLSVVDSTRRRWKDIDAYIRGRLSSSPPPETLSEEERERHAVRKTDQHILPDGIII
uniref:Uncharacterized protein n=1 Tax=Chromera velia CCMP2878 TaxID=1169474 RepID=A0A0G4GEX3_9ALVE|eukprot:Cvel_21588.t1-p1 / transcript=Cvel_21588.t1 / gene=Cvel_21588 / organism=Chromera_velia_CCMP2878 / gene_product=hypothetical protein / transcript_product=hypothetical protein / location=Cvel_scaffold2038:10163-11191(-) / protein_length=343 / sequence_SO=supercontig / SO=protein_coding / is_pseudo=false